MRAITLALPSESSPEVKYNIEFPGKYISKLFLWAAKYKYSVFDHVTSIFDYIFENVDSEFRLCPNFIEKPMPIAHL